MAETAVIMNMFYTGLGAARSLEANGVKVIGLSAHPRIFGNFTRCAKVLSAPDSRNESEALLDYLLRLAKELGGKPVIFPTRDDDVRFLDRFRLELEPHYTLAIPEREALNTCLSKWETFVAAERAGISTPKCWTITNAGDVARCAEEAVFPCVLKPVASYHWRQGANWKLVGARKAIEVGSAAELASVYASVSRADARALLQEMVPGPDDALVIVACYLDRNCNWVAGFNTQKLLQCPPVFGTGCILKAAHYPELFEPTARLLKSIGFNGIAEVEYKWDFRTQEFRLIEVNPRLWDQHRLGATCGVDLAYIAYCDYAGLPRPEIAQKRSDHRWIAEDTFCTYVLRMLWTRRGGVAAAVRLARRPRVYGIWSTNDPFPFVAYALLALLPQYMRAAVHAGKQIFRRLADAVFSRGSRALRSESLERGRTHG